MVSKSQIKLIRSLHQKKHRNKNGLFFVEGHKGVSELLASDLKPYQVFSSDTSIFKDAAIAVKIVSENNLRQMSALKNPSNVIGVFYMPTVKKVNFNDWIVVLDNVSDPGNLGTIIRLCDWFGIGHLVCSKKTVDCYNPKVLQATMGSITRVNIRYDDIVTFLKKCPLPVYGTFMNGVSVYAEKLPKEGVLVMGNEAQGISLGVQTILSKKISIPQYGEQTTESLNVAMATSILLNEIRRVGG